MSWVLLISALALEVFAAMQLQLSEGFTNFGYSFNACALYVLSFVCVIAAFKKIDTMLTDWYAS